MTDILRTIRIVILSSALVLAGLSLAGAEQVRGHRVPPSRSSGGSHGGHYGGHQSGYHPRYYHYGVGVSYYYLPYYYGGWGYYWGAPYTGYYAAYPGPYYVRDVAYIDTDVSPEKAQVFLDGQYMGVADDFDGFPQYLSVEPGKHVLRFEMEGRMSVTRTVRVPRGAVLDLDFTLPRGSGEAPSSGDEGDIVVPETPPVGTPAAEAGPEEPQGAVEASPDDAEPGFIRLKISPPDASVYIDGKFVGSAATLSRLHGDMRLKSGTHEVEVVRPGYRAARREVRIFAGDRITVEMSLEEEPRR